ncbi:N-acetyltransferase [Allostella sp. ATCC 35155]|nr:N-acetyltransferase [Stella sp. ATCC 35155]
MSEAVAVRPIARTDHDAWLPLWEGYNRFYERTAAPEVTAMTWSRFFDAYEPVHALVAEADGAVVGIVHYIFHRNTSMIGPTCYLQDLFTAPAARGQGVGRALIEAVYDAARAAGASRVYWMTHETNRTAMRLYDQVAERPGFLQYRRNL